MISSLRGVVTHRAGADVVVEVGGIGYLVTIPDRLALSLGEGEETLLYTSMVVREDHIALFGFGSRDDLGLFSLVRSVNGVGPKSALAILSHLSGDEIHDAVVTENDGAFRQVSGIGPKTAKLIVLSLQGAFDTVSPKKSTASTSDVPEVLRQSVVQALVGLGWSEKIAREGVTQALEEQPGPVVDAGVLLRQALTILGPKTSREARS